MLEYMLTFMLLMVEFKRRLLLDKDMSLSSVINFSSSDPGVGSRNTSAPKDVLHGRFLQSEHDVYKVRIRFLHSKKNFTFVFLALFKGCLRFRSEPNIRPTKLDSNFFLYVFSWRRFFNLDCKILNSF